MFRAQAAEPASHGEGLGFRVPSPLVQDGFWSHGSHQRIVIVVSWRRTERILVARLCRTHLCACCKLGGSVARHAKARRCRGLPAKVVMGEGGGAWEDKDSARWERARPETVLGKEKAGALEDAGGRGGAEEDVYARRTAERAYIQKWVPDHTEGDGRNRASAA